MHFFQNLKGNHSNFVEGSSTQGNPGTTAPHHVDQAREHHSGPSISQPYRSALTYAPSPGTPSGRTEHAQPPGLPPDRNEHAPPSGPPPQRNQYPLPQEHSIGHEYAPPIRPPLSQSTEELPPYHDWTVIPDTALLPPPPSFSHETSPSNNADLVEADRAHEWCRRYPLMMPHPPTPAQHNGVNIGDVWLMKPREFRGELLMTQTGLWKGSARTGGRDSCLITAAPLYFAFVDNPAHTSVSKTIYFEVKLRSLGSQHRSTEGSVAVGFCGMPYPTWRLPGWERASLAVHGDDGRRYVNDTYGGIDFTSPFQVGDTIGLGMKFAVPEKPPAYGTSSTSNPILNIEVFFTRNGNLDGCWNLHEELDSLRGIEGLDGPFDLYGALGTFGSVEFDCAFRRADWLWQPR
ncbi:hypothetical protein MMC31_004983 [Peltigera leucophlebia]|nr:hypothetical protein [Peltigera leucophlebia]